MPAALQIDWQPLRDAAIAGVPLRQIAEQYGITLDALRQRALRHKWPVPAAVRRLAAEHRRPGAPSGSAQQVSQGVAHVAESGANVTETVAATLEERAQAYSLAVFDYTAEKVKQAIKLDTIKPPVSAKEFDTMDRTARRAAGLDRPNVQIGVQLALFGASSGSGERERIEDDGGEGLEGE